MENSSLSTIQKIIDYIENHLFNELTPAGISAHFYVSESALSALFRVVCNMTLMEYIRNRRLTLAAEELSESNIPIIDLAYKYGYETPEAFTKAFSRFHGFPPSCIRRGFPVSRRFLPLKIEVSVQGGWHNTDLTKSNAFGQDNTVSVSYNPLIPKQGGMLMDNRKPDYRIITTDMLYQKEWNILSTLAEQLLQHRIPFKVDGKTMIFAHGLEFPFDKICLTFKWKDEEAIKNIFRTNTTVKQPEEGFKYFDVTYEGTKVRCMFYGNCPGDDTDEFLYKNTELIQIDALQIAVQSLEFYYENAEKNSNYYEMVEEWLKKHERL